MGRRLTRGPDEPTRIALVTSQKFPRDYWTDRDTPMVAQALKELGVHAETVAWDDSHIVWDRHDVIVLQSPWSMWEQLGAFDTWLQARVSEGATLLNPAGVLTAGFDKRYLGRLAAAGLPVVPTRFIEHTSRWRPNELRDDLMSVSPALSEQRRTIVVKPVSSGGSLGIGEFAIHEVDAASQHVLRMHRAGMSAIVQPYVAAIDAHRELGVITLGGQISHAITKRAILRPGDQYRAFHPDAQPYFGLTDAQREIVLATYRSFLSILPKDSPEPLSVRLDFVLDPESGTGLLLLEIESVAPVRFFSLFPDESVSYATEIVARARAVGDN
jgi:hypothetical protein